MLITPPLRMGTYRRIENWSRRSVKRLFLEHRATARLLRTFPRGRNFAAWWLPLHLSLPLDAPIDVMVEACNVCNFRCAFCPTGDAELLRSVERPKGFMDMHLFEKILADLREFRGRIDKVHLQKEGEPLLNKHLPRMIEAAKKAQVARTISVTTNASLLDREMSIRLLEAGLDFIVISVEHVTDEGYRELTKTDCRYEQIRKNVEILATEKAKRKARLHIFSKILDISLSEEQKRKFLDDFRPLSDETVFNCLVGWSYSDRKDFQLGTRPALGLDGTSPVVAGKVVCAQPFWMIGINFDGTVSPCCVDWSRSLLIGDARRESVGDIWRGDALRRIRMKQVRGQRRELPPCATCQHMLGTQEVLNLDDSAEGLIARYQ